MRKKNIHRHINFRSLYIKNTIISIAHHLDETSLRAWFSANGVYIDPIPGTDIQLKHTNCSQTVIFFFYSLVYCGIRNHVFIVHTRVYKEGTAEKQDLSRDYCVKTTSTNR